jgi:hypothetical protein
VLVAAMFAQLVLDFGLTSSGAACRGPDGSAADLVQGSFWAAAGRRFAGVQRRPADAGEHLRAVGLVVRGCTTF